MSAALLMVDVTTAGIRACDAEIELIEDTMSATLSRPKNRKGHNLIVNHRVELNGEIYRVCCQGKHVLLVARKTLHSERLLKYDGRRWRQVVKAVGL